MAAAAVRVDAVQAVAAADASAAGLAAWAAGAADGRRRGGGARPTPEDMEAQRALMQEVTQLPSRVTITQDGDKVMFVEPDGVVRSYLANGKTEKHQLTHGTIETKSSWDDARLKMEITVGRGKLVRTFGLRDNPRRLEVSTSFEGAPKDARRLSVYDEAPRSDRPRAVHHCMRVASVSAIVTLAFAPGVTAVGPLPSPE